MNKQLDLIMQHNSKNETNYYEIGDSLLGLILEGKNVANKQICQTSNLVITLIGAHSGLFQSIINSLKVLLT